MRIRILSQIQNYKTGYLKFRERFIKMYGDLPTRRSKKKLKSVYHYLVNEELENARHFYKQLEKELEKNGEP